MLSSVPRGLGFQITAYDPQTWHVRTHSNTHAEPALKYAWPQAGN